MNQAIITLLTDFGTRDHYVGVMKGVILSICSDCRIFDLSHGIEKHNIQEGAFFLLNAIKYYPKNTIHLVVIDPGVGSDRRAILIQSQNFFFIGPDNGVLSLAAKSDGVEKVVEISNRDFYLNPISDTFHGRDIFAPVAAHLAKIGAVDTFGKSVNTWTQFEFPKVKMSETEITAYVIHIDRFGNLITNLSKELFEGYWRSQPSVLDIEINNKARKIPMCSSYSQVRKGEILSIFGSGNFLEISGNQASASDLLSAKIRAEVKIKLSKH
jgi:S-adenosylmethionine hydrolase